MKIKNKIAAVVVIYFPEQKVLEQFEALQLMVDLVIWVNNTPESFNLKEDLLKKTLTHSAVFIEMDGNKGIAAALNKGIEYAKKEGFTWMLAMDQDSVPEKNMVSNLLSSYTAAIDDGVDNAWAISPTYHDINTNHVLRQGDVTKKYTKILATLTSGMLIRIDTLDIIGLHNEKYFIYHVDTEICLRANHKGFQLIESPHAVLYHQEGDQSYHKFLWKKGIITTNHSVFALYYMSRNTVYLTVNWLFIYPLTITKVIKHHYFTAPLKIILFESQKIKKIIAVIKGFYNGIFSIRPLS